MSGGIAGSTWRAAAMLDKAIIHVPWWYSGYADSPVVNCSEANVGKNCIDPPLACGNVKCAMDHESSFYDGLDRDWLAAGGTTEANLETWGRLQQHDAHALGVMTTQWRSSTTVGPDISGIPFAGEGGWNRAQTQATSQCAAATKYPREGGGEDFE